MSTPPPPRSPGPASPSSTRQLLDELDALMQRMLALPVNQLEDEPSAVPERGARGAERGTRSAEREAAPEGLETATARAEQRVSPSLDAPPLTEDSRRQVTSHPPAPVSPPHRPAPPAGEEAPRARFTPPDEPAVIIPPVGEPAPNTPAAPPRIPPPPPARPVTPPSRLRRIPSPLTQPAAAAAPSASVPAPRRQLPEWAMRTLVWSNRTFDRWTAWLGSPGRWLRGPRGRTILGWVGLGLWATALTLAVLRFLG